MICQRCGNNIPDGSKFCQRCGNMVAQSRPQQYPIQNKPFPQPQMPSDNGKKKDNVKVKILAIVLAGLILIVGLLAAVAGINSKKGIPSDALHVKDFPVLKRTAVLSVYDEEIFPAEEYEIKVEKYNMGGAFKNLGSKEVVLRDETTEPTYELELEDGDYRVTLTDTTERAERETTSANNSEQTENDVVYKDIVLEVRVDDDDEDAVDNAGIRFAIDYESLPPKESDFIEASEDNINDFIKMLNGTRAYCYEESLLEFNYTRASANDIAEIMSESYGVLYEYYFDDLESIGDDDPEGKYPEGSSRGSKEKFEWICEEVYNIKFDEDDCDEEFIYFSGDYFYLYEMPNGGGLSTYTLKSYERVGDKYEIIFEMSVDLMVEDYEGPRATFKATAAIKTNNGDRFWSVYKIEELDSEQTTTTTTEPTTQQPEREPKVVRETCYSEYDGGVTWTDYDYDTNGNNVNVTHCTKYGRIIYWYEYEYNDSGNMISETYYDEVGNMLSYNEFKYEYDANGNVAKRRRYYEDHDLKDWVEYEYDAGGNVVKETRYNADGSRAESVEYEYNARGNMVKSTVYFGNGNVSNWRKYEYDAAGNKVNSTLYNSNGTVAYRYEYEEIRT